MNHIMFSFLKPQICFGESTGGGGDGGGGGGRGSSYGMPGAGDGAATSAGQARAAQLRDEANAQRDAQERSDDYTPSYAELNAQLADLGATNMTDDYSIVDYSTTASGNPFMREGDNQNTQSEALIGQATDIGGGVYDPINILQTDAYQLGTGNAIRPRPPANDIAPESFMAPFNDPIGGGLDAGPFDVFGQDIYKPTPPVTYNSELDNSNYNEFVDTARYSGNESGTYPEAGSMDSIASNFYDDNYFQPDPINDILAGEEFATGAANFPAELEQERFYGPAVRPKGIMQYALDNMENDPRGAGDGFGSDLLSQEMLDAEKARANQSRMRLSTGNNEASSSYLGQSSEVRNDPQEVISRDQRIAGEDMAFAQDVPQGQPRYFAPQASDPRSASDGFGSDLLSQEMLNPEAAERARADQSRMRLSTGNNEASSSYLGPSSFSFGPDPELSRNVPTSPTTTNPLALGENTILTPTGGDPFIGDFEKRNFFSGMDGPSPSQLAPQYDPINDLVPGEVREVAPSIISMERDLLGALTPSGVDPEISFDLPPPILDNSTTQRPDDGFSPLQSSPLTPSGVDPLVDPLNTPENQQLFKELGIFQDETLASIDFNQSNRYKGYDTSPSVIRDLALGNQEDSFDIDQGFTPTVPLRSSVFPNQIGITPIPTQDQINNKNGKIDLISENNKGNPNDINPERFTSESLLASAYEKANSGRTSELTTAEQAVLFGQRGQQLNPAEMTQLAQVYQNTGKIPMTKEFQDSIIKSMRDPESISETIDGNISKTIGGKRNTRGATDAEIEAYKKANPIGQDINPDWKPYEELTGAEKFGRGVQNVITFLIKNATSGIIDFDKMNKNFSDKYLSAYQDPGQTGGQFLYGSETNDDISKTESGDKNFDRLVELSGTERGAEPILEGVMGSDGELVRGYDRYKNTIDGVEKVVDEGLQDDINFCPPGFYYDRVVESCMPIESLTDDTGAVAGPPNTIRPRPPSTPRPPTTNPTRPPVSQPISGGVTIRKPKFFRDGGSVTPNIDSFFSGMGR